MDERGATTIKFCEQPEHFITYKPGAAVKTPLQLAAAADQAARREGPEIQARHVHLRLHLAVRGEENLEPPVQEEAVHLVRPNPTADPI